VDYEWDRAKAAANRRKHGIDFRDAIAVLEDPNRLETVDIRYDYGEPRVQVIGTTRGRLLFVVIAEIAEDVCRIISARKATRDEQERYHSSD
jgi:hypothetical protein